MVNGLMNDLFLDFKNTDELPLLKSCVFHSTLGFIHPFLDENGRIGRLWQTVILMTWNPIFEFLPIATIIKERQEDYYAALSQSDKTGQSTAFVEFMLSIIESALQSAIATQHPHLTHYDRLMVFREAYSGKKFSRLDYLMHFKAIS